MNKEQMNKERGSERKLNFFQELFYSDHLFLVPCSLFICSLFFVPCSSVQKIKIQF
jgi:hypothetical protein